MKKYLFSLLFILVSYVGFSQKGLSYQAVILDPNAIEVPGQDISGQPLVNGDVWMKFSIYNGSSLQFEEVQKTKTDNYGLVNLMIGSMSSASFNSLVWDSSQKTLQVHVSFDQGGSYTKVSDQKLTYSPYTLFAETAGKLSGVLAIANGGTGATTVADARLNLGLDQVNNTSDAAKPVSTATQTALNLKANAADVNAGLALKANTTDMTAALAAKADTGTIKSFVLTQVAAATIADTDASTKGKIQLAGDLAGTADAPTVPGLALKENSANKSTNLSTDGTSDTKYPSVKSVKTYVDTQVAGATIADANATSKGKIQLAGDLAGTAAAPTVPGLALKENSANKSTNVSTDGASDSKYPSVKAVKSYVDAQLAAGVTSVTIADADGSTKGKIQLTGDLGGTAAAPTVPGLALKANATDITTLTATVNANTASITANTSSIAGETTRATAAELTLNTSIAANTASITANTSSITAETTRATAAELTLTNSIAANTSSITAETTRATAVELILTNNVSSNNSSITSNITSINLKAPLESPTFTGTVTTGAINSGAMSATSVNTPIYASTPQALTDAATITWNPANGLNASVTLGGNRTLSFSSTLAAGSYGTLVITQDVTGGRTITLPSTTNKILGSNSTTSIALSETSGATDILNFYYDGTNCFWNIGQGYGINGTTNLSSSVSGKLPVTNGGTGANTLTGIVKGNGTSALTTAVAGTDYISPTGSAAGLTNFPTLNQNTTGNAATSTTAGNITATSNATLTSLLSLNTIGTITSGTISVTSDIKTSGTLTAGTVTYPKTHAATSGQVLTSLGSGTLTWTTPSSGGGGTHVLGEQFGGGTVYYINSDGTHGLIVENADLGTSRPFTMDGVNSNGTMWMVGARYQSKNPLAHTTTEGKEFFDWEIPEIYELHYLYQAINSGNSVFNTLKLTFGTKSYWSNSFEQSYTQSFMMQFSNGSVANMGDRQLHNVRCIRRF